MRAHAQYENSNRILHGDQTTLDENFYKVNHAALTKDLCDAHADGRSVCGGYPSCIFCFC